MADLSPDSLYLNVSAFIDLSKVRGCVALRLKVARRLVELFLGCEAFLLRLP